MNTESKGARGKLWIRPGNRRQVNDYEESPRGVFAVFLAYIVVLYLQGSVRWNFLAALHAEMVIGLVLAAVALGLVLRRGLHGSRTLITWASLLLVLITVMVPLSQVPGVSWNVYWTRVLNFAAFGLCTATFLRSPRQLAWFMGAYLFAFLKMAQEGLTPGLMWENQEIPRLHGSTPNYGSPNSYSATQLGTLPFIWYLMPLAPWYLRLVLGVQAVLAGNVLLRAGSRTGYLGALAASSCLIWLSKNRLRALAATVAILVVAIPLIPASYIGRFESIYEDHSQAGDQTSVGDRKEILQDAVAVFAAHPLGVGVGAFPAVRMEMFGRSQDTHNLYLEVATNLGFLGEIVFLAFVWCLWKTLLGLINDFKDQQARLEDVAEEERPPGYAQHLADVKLLLAVSKATWVFLVIRVIVGLFGHDLYEIYWWFCAGLAVALGSMRDIAQLNTARLAGPKPVQGPLVTRRRTALARHGKGLGLVRRVRGSRS
jgi:putative inorganic carbon (HCO3(-)) transporter